MENNESRAIENTYKLGSDELCKIKAEITKDLMKVKLGQLKANLNPHKIYDMCKTIHSVIQIAERDLNQGNRVQNFIPYLFHCLK